MYNKDCNWLSINDGNEICLDKGCTCCKVDCPNRDGNITEETIEDFYCDEYAIIGDWKVERGSKIESRRRYTTTYSIIIKDIITGKLYINYKDVQGDGESYYITELHEVESYIEMVTKYKNV